MEIEHMRTMITMRHVVLGFIGVALCVATVVICLWLDHSSKQKIGFLEDYESLFQKPSIEDTRHGLSPSITIIYQSDIWTVGIRRFTRLGTIEFAPSSAPLSELFVIRDGSLQWREECEIIPLTYPFVKQLEDSSVFILYETRPVQTTSDPPNLTIRVIRLTRGEVKSVFSKDFRYVSVDSQGSIHRKQFNLAGTLMGRLILGEVIHTLKDRDSSIPSLEYEAVYVWDSGSEAFQAVVEIRQNKGDRIRQNKDRIRGRELMP